MDRPESIMERECLEAFLRKGIRPECQYPIGPFFADFAFPECKLLVEYDGADHWTRPVYDFKRFQYLRNAGWNVMRIANRGEKTYCVYLNDDEIGFADMVPQPAIEKAAKEAFKFFIHESPKGLEMFASERFKPFKTGKGFFHMKEGLESFYKKMENLL